MMLQRKVCLLGSFAVGKTSLAARFLDRPFTGRYLTTIGVRIDRKHVRVGDQDLMLLIWDLAGEDRFQRVEAAYLRGSSAYLLVVDGTRRSTLDQAMVLRDRASSQLGPVPFRLLLNKTDLVDAWDLDERELTPLHEQGFPMIRTSAKTGAGVESALHSLAGDLLEP
ncbi:MAG: Rab family GTPase [Limisphaerales bacterium]